MLVLPEVCGHLGLHAPYMLHVARHTANNRGLTSRQKVQGAKEPAANRQACNNKNTRLHRWPSNKKAHAPISAPKNGIPGKSPTAEASGGGHNTLLPQQQRLLDSPLPCSSHLHPQSKSTQEKHLSRTNGSFTARDNHYNTTPPDQFGLPIPGVGKGHVAAGRTGAGAEGAGAATVLAAAGAAGLAATGLAAGFLATAFLAAGFFAATAFLAAGFLATAFLAAGFFAATAFLATGFFAATTFLAAGFFAATTFLTAGFFAAAAFFAAGLDFFAATISTSLY